MSSSLFKATSNMVAAARSGRITHARKLFDEMPSRDTVAWNAMLTSYAHMGIYQQVFSLFQDMRVSNTKPDSFTFTAALSACAGAADVRYGSGVHGLVVVFGCQGWLPVGNALIDMYGKCRSPCKAKRVFEEMVVRNDISWCSLLFSYTNVGLLDVASEVFWRMPEKVGVSWNTMIAGYAKNGECRMCLRLFKRMRRTGSCPDQWTLSSLMNSFSDIDERNYGRMIQAFVIKSGWYASAEVQNSILSFYADLGSQDEIRQALQSVEHWNVVSLNSVLDAHMKLGDTQEASALFQQMPEKNVVSWTSMIAGYSRNGREREAIGLFVDMMRHFVKPDELAFGATLLACSGLSLLGHGMMIHGCLFRYGLQTSVYVGNGLVNMYAKCGDLVSASRAFSEIVNKDLVSWNTMLFAYGLHGRADHALQLYEKMIGCGIRPDVVTFIGLLMTCSHAGLVGKAHSLFKSMHSVHGLSHEIDHIACIVDMLGRGGYLAEAGSLANHYQGLKALRSCSSEALLGASSVNLDVRLATQVGQDLMLSEPQKDTSYVLLSNLYCASGQWKEAETVRKIMADQGVTKLPGCSWIEVKNELTCFVSGDQSNLCMDNISEMLHNLEFEMKHPGFRSISV